MTTPTQQEIRKPDRVDWDRHAHRLTNSEVIFEVAVIFDLSIVKIGPSRVFNKLSFNRMMKKIFG